MAKKKAEARHCAHCGKVFLTSSDKKIYCSDDCRLRHNYAKAAKPAPVMYHCTCPQCKKSYESKNRRTYCSRQCRNAAEKAREKSSGKDRELTTLTIYLVHKYSFEGMPLTDIAQTLNRSVESVSRALSTPISKEQLASIKHYAKLRGKGNA